MPSLFSWDLFPIFKQLLKSAVISYQIITLYVVVFCPVRVEQRPAYLTLLGGYANAVSVIVACL